MSKKGGIISKIEKGSLAEKAGLSVGDKILSVNDMPVKDLIDLNFALSDEEVEILVEDSLGNTKSHYFQKRFGDAMGMELETAVFDSIRQCANRCIFCFIDQMPKGLRESLYVKDDDYRMSFLHGNYITFTNITPMDIQRIKAFHLSPLYVSIHTMNGELRKKMMNHCQAHRIVDYLAEMRDSDIEIHGQIVMVPGYNDGAELEYTLETLYKDYPNVVDVAVVPIGISKYREGLAEVESVTKEKALETIAIVEKIQKKARKERKESFVYLADEFYLKAEIEYPKSGAYDGFPLLEDGIGMGRKFEEEWHAYHTKKECSYEEKKDVVLVTGTAIGEFMNGLVSELDIPNLNITVLPVTNTFFGSSINVTGLLTAQDIISALQEAVKERGNAFDGIIIPGVCLRKGVPVFLDDATVDDVEKALQTDVRICHFAEDLQEQLHHWR